MAKETTVTFNINIRSSYEAGRNTRWSPQAQIKEVEKQAFNAFNYIVTDIAFKATMKQKRMIQNQLEERFHGIAMTELRNMGRKIASLAIGLGGQHRWPKGSLDIEGPKSKLLAATDPTRVEAMKISDVTGQWRARTKEYLQYKSRKYGHRKWWLTTGDLRQQLTSPAMYIGAFGPIRVMWTPERQERGFHQGGILRYSSLARGRGNTYALTTGHIKMAILGRITRQMLNAPGFKSYDSRFNGLLGMLPEDVENKLAGRGDPYRPLLEPFLTFYLNRQIPNRIFHALTETIGGGKSLQKSIRPLGARA